MKAVLSLPLAEAGIDHRSGKERQVVADSFHLEVVQSLSHGMNRGRLAATCVAEILRRSGVAGNCFGPCRVQQCHPYRTSRHVSCPRRRHERGVGVEAPSLTLNRLCGSGLQAVISVAESILLRDTDHAIAARAEVMSRARHASQSARFFADMMTVL